MSNEIVFFLTKLVSEEQRDAYEAWVSDVDTPLALALKGVESYRVVRLENEVMDGVATPGFSYIEIVEISDLATYQESITSTPASFFEQFGSYIASFDAVAGTVIN